MREEQWQKGSSLLWFSLVHGGLQVKKRHGASLFTKMSVEGTITHFDRVHSEARPDFQSRNSAQRGQSLKHDSITGLGVDRAFGTISVHERQSVLWDIILFTWIPLPFQGASPCFPVWMTGGHMQTETRIFMGRFQVEKAGGCRSSWGGSGGSF